MLRRTAQAAGQSFQRYTAIQNAAPVAAVVGPSHVGALNPDGARHASNEAVKLRMKSVKNIMKITSAMKVVAAAKLNKVKQISEKSRYLPGPIFSLLGETPNMVVPKTVIVPITSDRGLCGGINTTAVKYTRTLAKMIDEPDTEYHLCLVGDKGKAQLSRDQPEKIVWFIGDLQKQGVTFSQCSLIAEEVLKTEYDSCKLVFNYFKSVIAFKPTVATILSPESLERSMDGGGSLDSYEMEGPDRAEMLQDLGEFQLAATLYSAYLENATSEQASRMSAMDNSSRNASDMLERLTLFYNRSRQAAITTELIEIISGAAALEG